MSKNLFLMLLILCAWLFIINVAKKKELPKKELKADSLIKYQPKTGVDEKAEPQKQDMGRYYTT